MLDTPSKLPYACSQMFAAFGDALLAPLPLETQTQFRRLWHNFGNTLRGVQRACHNGVRHIVSFLLLAMLTAANHAAVLCMRSL